MKLYPNGFKCFTCNEHGDVTDLVAKLRGLPPVDAARELNNRYGLGLTIGQAATPQERTQQRIEAKKRRKQQELTQAFKEWEVHAWRVLSEYYRLLTRWKGQYAPQTPEELNNPSAFYFEANRQEYIAYLLDILDGDSYTQKVRLFQTHRHEVRTFEQRLQQLWYCQYLDGRRAERVAFWYIHADT